MQGIYIPNSHKLVPNLACSTVFAFMTSTLVDFTISPEVSQRTRTCVTFSNGHVLRLNNVASAFVLTGFARARILLAKSAFISGIALAGVRIVFDSAF